MSWYGYPAYASVAERKEKAAKVINKLKKKGHLLSPIIITGKMLVKTFWGKAWCDHLESYSDYENRLPRGRSYARNGAIIDLAISHGAIRAKVQGTRLYNISITIKPYVREKWQALITDCSGKIDSLIELLQGKFSKGVMEIITDKSKGLFPNPNEIQFDCSCPDYAMMCKHVAAVLYGIGARLDEKPEELFMLRSVDHLELISASNSLSVITKAKKPKVQLADNDLAGLFDIDIAEAPKKIIAQENKKAIKKLKKKETLKKKIIRKTVKKIKKVIKRGK